MNLSIKHKFIIGFLIIFCFGYTLMSFFINKLIIENNKTIIRKELTTFQKDLTIYLKQYFQLKEKDIDVISFNDNAENISSKLSVKIEDRVIVYSSKGELLADSAKGNGQVVNYEDIDKKEKYSQNEDLKLAVKNNSAFSMIPIKDKYIVVFSCPIINDGKNIGIIRCVKDYSEIFSSSKELMKFVNTFMLIVVGGIFLFVLLLSTKITVPIIKLSKVSKEVAKGNFDIEVNVSSQDEIGQLALDFNKMRIQINDQIEKIKKDRDSLKKAESHRKIFFDNITHEMKTPLTIISGYAQVLINQEFKDKEFSKNSLSKIKKESERMHKMVLDLLEMSKVKSDVDLELNKELNISQIIDSACNDMKIKADKYEILIDKHIEKDIVVLGNANELRRAIINLIDNSIKYGFVKSCINIKVFKEKNICNIVIKDEGKGIPQDKLEKIFQPFYRIDKKDSREKGSCGLGLSIVKKIVDKHDGYIKIISEEQVGTTINIEIPLKVYKMETLS